MKATRWVRASLLVCAAAAAPLQLAAGRAAPRGPAARPSPQGPAAQNASTAPTPRTLTVTVTDEKGRPVEGLGREMFKVLDGGREAEIVSFSRDDAPATVVVLLDLSGSMGPSQDASKSGPVAVRNALLRFFHNCNAADEFSLIAFNVSPQVLLDSSNDPAAVIAALDRYAAAKAQRYTALYDALYLAVARAERGRHAKRVVLLVSDGQDNSSRYTRDELKRRLKESDVVLYAVAPVPDGDDSVLGYGGRDTLQELTSISGGKVLFALSVDGLHAAMQAAAQILRRQYTVGFVPAPTARRDGWHSLSVRVGEGRDARGKKVKTYVSARAGFYDVPPPRR